MLVALVANGSLLLWPIVKVSVPEPSVVTLAPIVSFGLLALILGLSPKFVNRSVIVGSAFILVAICILLLSPALTASESTDAQTGMGEALLAMATVPYTILVIIVGVVINFGRSRNAQ